MTSIAQQYQKQGYIFPLQAFTPDEAHDYRKQFETAEKKFSSDIRFREIIFGSANFALPFIDQICRLPSILNPVREILGENLIVWGSGFFNKEPQTSQFISWHQDLTYWGLSDVQEVTVWIALSNVTVESGCMRFVPGSHLQEIVPHRDTFSDDNLLSRGQEIAVDVDEDKAVKVTMQPGEFSLHHGRMFHASGPNRSDQRRIGLAIRYITPQMHQSSGEKPWVHLVSGEDTSNHFQLMPPTKNIMDPACLEAFQYNMKVQQQDLYKGTGGKGKRSVAAPAEKAKPEQLSF